MAVAHLPLDFRPGGQRGHRVHYYHIQGAGADQGLSDLQTLFTGVRLGDQH